MSASDDGTNLRLFRHAAAQYDRYRAAYPADLVAGIVRLCSLGPTSRVMDLGCGPGTLARAIAPHVGAVVGIDPEPEMIRQARAGPGSEAIDFVVGSSHDLSPHPGPFDAILIGRALHWMDGDTIAGALHDRLRRGGWVAIVSNPRRDDPRNAWWEAIKDVRLRYDPTNGARASLPPARDPGQIFAPPHFAAPLFLETRVRRDLTVPDLLGLLFTFPGTTPAELGARLAPFERDIRARVTPFLRDAKLSEFLAPGAVLFQRT